MYSELKHFSSYYLHLHFKLYDVYQQVKLENKTMNLRARLEQGINLQLFFKNNVFYSYTEFLPVLASAKSYITIAQTYLPFLWINLRMIEVSFTSKEGQLVQCKILGFYYVWWFTAIFLSNVSQKSIWWRQNQNWCWWTRKRTVNKKESTKTVQERGKYIRGINQ